jgi:hypothetical protein
LLNPSTEPAAPAMPAAPIAEQGRWESDGLDVFTFRQQCLQTSPLYARVSAPAVQAALTPRALAALANFADGMLQLAPQPAAAAEQQPGLAPRPPQPPQQGGSQRQQWSRGLATTRASAGSSSSSSSSSGGAGGGLQVAVEVECNVTCRLLEEPASACQSAPVPAACSLPLFVAKAQGVQLLSVGNLSGVSGAGALVLTCEGLDLRSGAGTYLLHRPAGATVDGHAAPGLEVVHIARWAARRARQGCRAAGGGCHWRPVPYMLHFS